MNVFLISVSRPLIVDVHEWVASGWKQELTGGIVRFRMLKREVAMLDGVAVDAAVRAGVVLADVARGEAGALLAVASQRHVVHD